MLAKRLILTLVLALSLILALLRLMTSLSVDLPLAHAADHTVCLAGPPTCTYTNVQAAVDAAASGDVIKVAAGTYTGVSARRSGFGNPVFITQTVYISKNLAIRGGYTTAFTEPPDPQINSTILDAQRQGRVLVTVGVSPTIEGLKLMHGNANIAGDPLGGPEYYGGGVLTLGGRPVFSSNVVFDNKSDQGGGIYVFSGVATLNSNVIVSNTASTYGGGVGVISGTVFMNYNQLFSNTAFYGGGFYGYGTLNANLFRTNTANYGGGLYSVFSTLINNIIADNQAAITGSGLYLTGPSSLSHNTFVHNSGAEGSAIYVASYYSTSSNAVLTNTIIASQTVGITVTAGNTATLNSTLWSGNSANWGGGGTISSSNNYVGSPLFIDSNSGNYHIGPTSAAIDKGVDAGVATDIDGDLRPQGLAPDLGADEYADSSIPASNLFFMPVILKQ